MLDKLKEILKENGVTGKDLSEMLNMTYGSYRSLTRKSSTHVPKWVRSAIIFYELGRLSNIEVNEPEELN